MKMMRIIVLSVISVLLLTSCGPNDDANSDGKLLNSTEAVTTATTVPTPTEKPKLKNVPWGKDAFTSLLPECKTGAVTQITPGDDLCLVVVEQLEESDAVSYMDTLAGNGFTRIGSETDLHTAGVNYSNPSGVTVNVVYTSGIMTLMIQK